MVNELDFTMETPAQFFGKRKAPFFCVRPMAMKNWTWSCSYGLATPVKCKYSQLLDANKALAEVVVYSQTIIYF